MKDFLLSVLFIFPLCMHAGLIDSAINISDTACNQNQIFEKVEQMPWFTTGSEAYLKKLNKSVKLQDTLNGNMVLILGINCTGRIFSLAIKKGINDLVNYQITKALLNHQDWMPGKQNGHPIDCGIPFRIKIVNGKIII